MSFFAYGLNPTLVATFKNYRTPSYPVTYTVTDENGDFFEGALVSIDEGEKTLLTDASGEAFFSLSEGDHTYTITANGYKNISKTLTVDGDKTVSEQMELT